MASIFFRFCLGSEYNTVDLFLGARKVLGFPCCNGSFCQSVSILTFGFLPITFRVGQKAMERRARWTSTPWPRKQECLGFTGRGLLAGICRDVPPPHVGGRVFPRPPYHR